MTRRDSIITLGMLCASLPLSLWADEKNGAFVIESGDKESRFKIGKDAFLLRANSKIALVHDGIFTQSLSLLGGGAMGVFGGGTKTIQTKTFTAGIRGTGIYLEEYANDAVYSCLCYGNATYKHPTSQELLLNLECLYHDKPIQIVKTKMGKLEYQDSKEPNHTDDELRDLEKMCGRSVPFEAFLQEQLLKGKMNHSY